MVSPLSRKRGPESGIVSQMEEDSTMQRAVFSDLGPTAAGNSLPFVIAVPAELDPLGGVPGARLPIDVPLDGDEGEGASPVGPELEQRWSQELDGIVIPQIHLDDPPGSDHSMLHIANVPVMGSGVGRTTVEAPHSATMTR